MEGSIRTAPLNAFICISIIFCLVAGCGGGTGGGTGGSTGASGGGSSPASSGTISVVLPFPGGNNAAFSLRIIGDISRASLLRAREDVPPDLSYYIVSVCDRGTCASVVNPVRVDKPSSGTSSQARIEGVPVGWKTVWVNAYNSEGLTIGSGCVDVEVKQGDNNSPLEITITPTQLLETLTISPDSYTLAPGDNIQMRATGLYRDGTIEDVTSEVSWSCDNKRAGRINSQGIFTAVSSGTFPQTANITATLDGITSNISVITVSENAPQLLSITIAPSSSNLTLGGTQQFIATGHYSDGTAPDITALVTWNCDNASAGGIDASGLFTAVSSGTFPQAANITAYLSDVTSDKAEVTIEAKLTSIDISPVSAKVGTGGTEQYSATGHYNDGTTAPITNDVSWDCDNENAGSIDSTGLFTAASSGTFPQTGNITAVLGSVTSNTATVTVISPGSLKWRYGYGNGFATSPSLSNDESTIYIGSTYTGGDGGFVALNSNDGSLKWAWNNHGSYTTASVSTDGKIVVKNGVPYSLTDDGSGYTINWTFVAGPFVNMGPSQLAIGSDGRIYNGGMNANPSTFAIDPSNGSLLAAFGGYRTIYLSSVTIASDGSLYNCEQGWPPSSYPSSYFRGFNTSYGNKFSDVSLGSGVANSPSTEAPIAFDGTVYVLTPNWLRAFNPNGTSKWTISVPGGTAWDWSPAIGADGTVYLPTYSGLYALNPSDGSTKWSHLTGTSLGTPAVNSDNTIYVGGSGVFYAVKDNGSSASTLWSYNPSGSVYYPTIGSDGTIYFSTYNGAYSGYVYALNGISPPASSSWPMFRHDAQHSGRVH